RLEEKLNQRLLQRKKPEEQHLKDFKKNYMLNTMELYWRMRTALFYNSNSLNIGDQFTTDALKMRNDICYLIKIHHGTISQTQGDTVHRSNVSIKIYPYAELTDDLKLQLLT